MRLQFGAEMDARPQLVDSAVAPPVARWHYGLSQGSPFGIGDYRMLCGPLGATTPLPTAPARSPGPLTQFRRCAGKSPDEP